MVGEVQVRPLPIPRESRVACLVFVRAGGRLFGFKEHARNTGPAPEDAEKSCPFCFASLASSRMTGREDALNRNEKAENMRSR